LEATISDTDIEIKMVNPEEIKEIENG